MLYHLSRSLLFLLKAEKAHQLTFKCLKIALSFPFVKPVLKYCNTVKSGKLKRSVCGINFPNPVGLAAGFDKNARLIDEWEVFGFGFIEIGTVTPRPQPGNPKPRLFRLLEDKAIINRMGFNNDGADVIAQRLAQRKSKIIVGGNIGKNKDTPNEHAVTDYLICFNKLYDVVDYFVVNVSSPNTPGLRELQEAESLKTILSALKHKSREKNQMKPIFLKISPDLTQSQLDQIIGIVEQTNTDGIIATNTTISRTGLKSSARLTSQVGGLSGKPLKAQSTAVLAYLAKQRTKKFALIASGGIHDPIDAVEKINSGADLLQLFTGFIYEGPGLVKQINWQLCR